MSCARVMFTSQQAMTLGTCVLLQGCLCFPSRVDRTSSSADTLQTVAYHGTMYMTEEHIVSGMGMMKMSEQEKGVFTLGADVVIFLDCNFTFDAISDFLTPSVKVKLQS